MKKKWNSGFTLAEIIAILVIMGLVTAVVAEAYIKIVDEIKLKSFENKVSYVLSKSENWAFESGLGKVNIKYLIENGIIEADDKNGDFVNPIDDESMLCWVVDIKYKEGGYVAEFTGERM